VLTRFQLREIRPAPRGEPQIEVTFDIDTYVALRRTTAGIHRGTRFVLPGTRNMTSVARPAARPTDRKQSCPAPLHSGTGLASRPGRSSTTSVQERDRRCQHPGTDVHVLVAPAWFSPQETAAVNVVEQVLGVTAVPGPSGIVLVHGDGRRAAFAEATVGEQQLPHLRRESDWRWPALARWWWHVMCTTYVACPGCARYSRSPRVCARRTMRRHPACSPCR
jgi:hypothetical protein